MADLLLHLELSDAAPATHDRLVAQAADLVEAFTRPDEDGQPARLVALVADPIDCLEIGLGALGTAVAPTLETSAPLPAPVTLFPFGAPVTDNWDEWAAAFAALRELAATGAVAGLALTGAERDPDAGSAPAAPQLPAASEALAQALQDSQLRFVIAFGPSPRVEQVLRRWSRQGGRRVVRSLFGADPDGQLDRVAEQLLADEGRAAPGEDAFADARRRGVRDAVALSALLDQPSVQGDAQ